MTDSDSRPSVAGPGAAVPMGGRPHELFSATRGLFREIAQDASGAFGLAIVLLLIVVAVAAPLLAPHDPTAQSLRDRLDPPFWLEGGSVAHLFGTDNLGRDIFSRVIYGARVSLFIGLSVVVIAGGFGVVMGLLAGYRGGRTDSIIMRVVDTQVAFPGLLLALVILAVVGGSVLTVVLVLAFNGWMVYARMTRGIVMSVRRTPYVEAAEMVGCRGSRVMFRHILPNLTSPLLTLAILEFARIILAEAALSFLGIGIQPPGMSWGLDVATGRDYMYGHWWVITFPGLAISLTVLGVNLLASWARVTSDPQEREKRFARRVAARRPRPAFRPARPAAPAAGPAE